MHPSFSRRTQGFTLIELMIVVAIIGILAGIAIFAYANYGARAKVGSALADVTPAKTGVEARLNSGVHPDDLSLVPTDAGFVGVPVQTQHCDMELGEFSSDGAGVIRCVIRDAPPTVNGESVGWRRGALGSWQCVSSVPERVRPSVCVEQ